MAFAIIPPLNAGNYTTAGDGTTYTLSKLSQTAGSGVTADGNIYTLSDSITIAAGDKFQLDDNAVMQMGDKVAVIVNGDANLAVAHKATITRANADAKPVQIEFYKEGATVNIKNVTFDYQGIRLFAPVNLNVDSCTFTNYAYANRIAGPIGIAVSGSKLVVTNTLFDHNQYSSISGAANVNASVRVENCVFNKSQQVNRNMPMLNLNQGDSIIVRNNVFHGDSTKTLVGAISVANMLGTAGRFYVLIENNTIDSCRYGINIQGSLTNVIIRGNKITNNRFVLQNNANNGGSGIAVYDISKSLNLTITGNIFENNLWGVTVMGGGNINMGKIEVDGTPLDPSDPEYNEGKNIFRNNGNNGKLYDLAFAGGTSYLTVYAQNNHWNVTNQTEEEIETVIDHQKDNPDEGLVIFMPAMVENTSSISHHKATDRSVTTVSIYNMSGQTISSLQHGVNIIKLSDGSIRKIIVR